MFKAIKEFFVGKPVDAVAPGGAPYKVDAPWTLPEPAITTPIPLVVEPAYVVAEVAAETVATIATVVSEVAAPVEAAVPAAKPKRAAKPKAPAAAKAKSKKA